jgi:membrane protein YqaA with SNARE-associated domain
VPELLAACLVALGVGYASALIPLINVEAIALAGGATTSVSDAVIVTAVLAVGQTLGKITIFYGVRTGRKAAAKKKAEVALERAEETLEEDQAQHLGWRELTWKGRIAWLRSLMMESLAHPWQGPAVVFISGSVGIPPLLVTAAAAGLSQMRIVPFVVTCFTGRWVRLLVIAIPAALAFHH